MGCKQSKDEKKHELSPPTIATTKTKTQIRQIIGKALGNVASGRIKLADRDYGLYSKEDLKRFLSHDNTDKYKYQKQQFDCDDFADVLKGREREWYRFHEHEKLGSSFGIVWGDIRHKDRPDKKRGHAVNYCITSDGKFRLIEPQTDTLFKLVEGSTIWLVIG